MAPIQFQEISPMFCGRTLSNALAVIPILLFATASADEKPQTVQISSYSTEATIHPPKADKTEHEVDFVFFKLIQKNGKLVEERITSLTLRAELDKKTSSGVALSADKDGIKDGILVETLLPKNPKEYASFTVTIKENRNTVSVQKIRMRMVAGE